MAPGRALLPAALLALALSPGPAAALPCGAHCPAGTYVASADCGWGAGASCRPCPAGTFSSVAELGGCRMCRQCEGVFRYLKNCSSTSDAECTCKAGSRCGDDGCTFCTQSCGVGQESTSNGCQTCRYGTFNDQPNGSCKNWTTCSGNQILVPGTAAKDVICKHASVNSTSVTTLPTTSLDIPFSTTVPGKDVQTDIIRISLAVAGLSCLVFLLPLCICFSVWQKKKLHAVFKKMHTPEQSVQEDDACSCHFPEEEQVETLREAVVDLNSEKAVTVQLDCTTFSPTSSSFDLLGDVNVMYIAAQAKWNWECPDDSRAAQVAEDEDRSTVSSGSSSDANTDDAKPLWEMFHSSEPEEIPTGNFYHST